MKMLGSCEKIGSFSVVRTIGDACNEGSSWERGKIRPFSRMNVRIRIDVG